MKVLRILGLAGDLSRRTHADGQWVKAYDPDANDGRGALATTDDPADARRFVAVGDAWDFYRQTSRVHPVRLTDGQPNRPLTAFSVVIEDAPDGR